MLSALASGLCPRSRAVSVAVQGLSLRRRGPPSPPPIGHQPLRLGPPPPPLPHHLQAKQHIFSHVVIACTSDNDISSAARGMEKSEAELKTLWAEAYDAWKGVPGHPDPTVYLMPEPPEPPPGGFPDPPEAVRGAVLFGLTSWNPLGQEAPLEENLKSYRSLRADLQGLEPRPRAMWESFGFDASGYRENGFTVAFDEEVAAAARKAVVAVANKYRQGAVYEFRLGPPGSGRLVRSTVPALLQEVGADTVMVVCPSKPDLGPPSDPDLHFEAH